MLQVLRTLRARAPATSVAAFPPSPWPRRLSHNKDDQEPHNGPPLGLTLGC